MNLITFHSAWKLMTTTTSKHCLLESFNPLLSIVLHIVVSLTKMGHEPVFTQTEKKKWKKKIDTEEKKLSEERHLLRPLFNDLKCCVCVSLTANVIFYSNSFIPSQQAISRVFTFLFIYFFCIFFFQAVASFATVVILHMAHDYGQCSSAHIIYRLRRSGLTISVGLH